MVQTNGTRGLDNIQWSSPQWALFAAAHLEEVA